MKKVHLLKNKNGMTLVEVVTSIAILSLLTIFLTSVFTSSIMVVGKQAGIKKSNTMAAAGIENAVAGFPKSDASVTVSQTSGNFEITFNGVTISQAGTYYQSTEAKSEEDYLYFVPNS